MLDKFTWYKQSALRWRDEGLVVYIDPWGLTGDLPPADIVLITHAHADHLSFKTLDRLPPAPRLYAPPPVAAWLSRLGYSNVMALAPGERAQVGPVTIAAACLAC